MKYYVAADVHGFCTEFRSALEKAGYFSDQAQHKLVILGDLFDRGKEARAMQDFILQLLDEDAVILIRGNHEDLFTEMVTVEEGLPVRHHESNGTYETALQLTGFEPYRALAEHFDFAEAAQKTPYFRRIIPSTIDYCETEHYIFVHGWIPDGEDWRHAGRDAWHEARWSNGMEEVQRHREEKTILCGHWHCSYGHAVLENRGSEFGPDADFSPYYAPGIIALDPCTAHSRIVNVVVIEDGEIL